MPSNITATSSSDWKYISEGGSSIVFSYIGSADEFIGTALRLRKIENKLPYTEYADGKEELDDPTILFQHRIIEKLVPSAYLPRLDSVQTDREWLELLAKQSEEKRPAERRAKDRIDAGRRKAVLATDLVGGLGWAVEIKPKWGFLPSPQHLSKDTAQLKTRSCRFCMHSHLKTTESEDVALGYCPLDLYSGDKERVTKALHTLWDIWIGSSGKVNNLRVFVEGHMLKPSMSPSSLQPLAAQILPQNPDDLPDLNTLRDAFTSTILPLLLDTPVLRLLSTHQRQFDALDVEGLSALWKHANQPLGSPDIPPPVLGEGLAQPTLEELEAFVEIYLAKHTTMDHDHPDTANLKYYCLAYLLSASFKDCSVILRMVPVKDGEEPWRKSVTVIDLDVKSVDRLHKWEQLDQKIVEAYIGLPEPTHCIDQTRVEV
ncbi:Inositol-pentakisphosphate 2-kinase [Steccherinum ochraceum]|uniref:Inositol-pentakisphosphate 2-kinase n=1 Tax=Steccherinum ochraceum TaxID=92696 RepID=A0A4R0RF83_9APHY|nr:Inositol-pentakisphosphate 2-kinase [Steccherinum ochraceum]